MTTTLISDQQLDYLQRVMFILESNGRTNSRMYEVVADAVAYGYYHVKNKNWFNETVREYYIKNK